MKIVVAGPGCPRCHAVERNVVEACNELKLDADVSHVFDIREYPKLGVRVTPSVLVEGKIVCSGKLFTVEELKRVLSEVK